MLIKMKDLSNGASCNRDAKLLVTEIEKALTQNEKITIDFEGIERYALLFFNFSLLQYAQKFGKNKYDETFTIINLSKLGKEVYSWFYEDAVEHPIKYTQEQMKCLEDTVNNIGDLD